MANNERQGNKMNQPEIFTKMIAAISPHVGPSQDMYVLTVKDTTAGLTIGDASGTMIHATATLGSTGRWSTTVLYNGTKVSQREALEIIPTLGRTVAEFLIGEIPTDLANAMGCGATLDEAGVSVLRIARGLLGQRDLMRYESALNQAMGDCEASATAAALLTDMIPADLDRLAADGLTQDQAYFTLVAQGRGILSPVNFPQYQAALVDEVEARGLAALMVPQTCDNTCRPGQFVHSLKCRWQGVPTPADVSWGAGGTVTARRVGAKPRVRHGVKLARRSGRAWRKHR